MKYFSNWFIVDHLQGAHMGVRAIIDENGLTICSPSPMGARNARLIRCAPDMFDTLKRFEEQFASAIDSDDEINGADAVDFIGEYLTEVRAVLARVASDYKEPPPPEPPKFLTLKRKGKRA